MRGQRSRSLKHCSPDLVGFQKAALFHYLQGVKMENDCWLEKFF